MVSFVCVILVTRLLVCGTKFVARHRNIVIHHLAKFLTCTNEHPVQHCNPFNPFIHSFSLSSLFHSLNKHKIVFPYRLFTIAKSQISNIQKKVMTIKKPFMIFFLLINKIFITRCFIFFCSWLVSNKICWCFSSSCWKTTKLIIKMCKCKCKSHLMV